MTLVRAEVTVDGGSVRYFRMSRKFADGWMVVGESGSCLNFVELAR